MRHGDRSLSYLATPAFRTPGHGLGSSVTKKARHPAGAIESCPWCLAPQVDDAAHAITGCMHRASITIRDKWTPPIVDFMRWKGGTWAARSGDPAATGTDKARLLLNAVCWPGLSDPHRREAVRRVASLLCEIRKHHPTYQPHFHGAPLEKLGYY